MSLLISIHDVTPALDAQVRELWELCLSCGVVPALLVVPDWHGAWPIEAHSAFMQWVQACADNGADIFLHGERHDEVGLPRSWSDSARAFGKTAREGEFLTLRRNDAELRIVRGIARLRALNLEPIGFIAPAWLARAETYEAVAAAGLALSEDTSHVRIHARDRKVRSVVVRWSGRTPLRALGSEIIAQYRWVTRSDAALTRIALHPQDLANARTARSVRREVARWTAELPAVRYSDLLTQPCGRTNV